MNTLLAKHQNGTTVYVDLLTKLITVQVPFEILYSNIRDERFENNRLMYVSECDFFHNYIGVGSTKALAFTHLQEVLTRVFMLFIEDGSFLEYLEREQKFKVEDLVPAIDTDATYSVLVRTDVC